MTIYYHYLFCIATTCHVNFESLVFALSLAIVLSNLIICNVAFEGVKLQSVEYKVEHLLNQNL